MRLGWRLKAQEDESFCVGVLSIRVCADYPHKVGVATQLTGEREKGLRWDVDIGRAFGLEEKPLNADDDDRTLSLPLLDVAHCRRQ